MGRAVVRALVLLACLFAPWRAEAALAVVQRTDSGGTQVGNPICTTNFGASVTAGNLLVVLAITNNPSTSATDTLGNTFLASTATPWNGTQTGVRFSIYYAISSGSGTDQVCINQGSVFSDVVGYEISGADTSSPFVADSTGDGNSTTVTTGTFSLSGVSSIILGIFQSYPQTATAFTGYTQTANDASNFRYDTYHITSSNEAAGATIGSATGWDILAAAFKVSSGGGAAPCRLLLLGVGCG